MNITTVGIDLAKNVFQVHAVDGRGKVVLRKQLRRAHTARVTFLPYLLIGLRSNIAATRFEAQIWIGRRDISGVRVRPSFAKKISLPNRSVRHRKVN